MAGRRRRRRRAGPRHHVVSRGRRRSRGRRSSRLHGSRSGGRTRLRVLLCRQRSADALPRLCIRAVGRGVETVQRRTQRQHGEAGPDRHVDRATDGEVLVRGSGSCDGIDDARRLEAGQSHVDCRRELAGRAVDGCLWRDLSHMGRGSSDDHQRAPAVAEHQAQASGKSAPERPAVALGVARGPWRAGSG
jgi:hypothetical protein